MSAQDEYQPTEEVGTTPTNNDYTLRRGQASEIPVQKDDAPVESGLGSRDQQDSDEQLGMLFPSLRFRWRTFGLGLGLGSGLGWKLI